MQVWRGGRGDGRSSTSGRQGGGEEERERRPQGRSGEAGLRWPQGRSEVAAGSSDGGEGEAAEGRLGDTGAAPVAAVASGCRRRGVVVERARDGLGLRKICGRKGQRGGGPTCKWRPENSVAHLLVGAPQKCTILWRIC